MNYTFDRRFHHGATSREPEVVGRCAGCTKPWQRYQAAQKCGFCRMEILLCKDCDKEQVYKSKKLKCHLCGGPKPTYLDNDADFKPVPQVKGSYYKDGGDY